ncbi:MULTISPECIES: nuclear transport factor 2 family protein [unclassified Sphingobium]|uniref:nuclear transport factor 2 family protein n=1 Tax=unclassified Sphingobium TaxID=2611147 RepID=UPI002223FD0D|nr:MULTISPECIES: nuclear transport factor 2 family protein [unclassified Sphingobium]MCW2413476.1 ketosteroid isomerase-like protein [Sphingobium sp. B8D3D]
MRRFTTAVALTLAICTSPIHAQSPEDQVRKAIAGMISAAEKLDADDFMRSYWQSPSLVITFDGETMRGWDVILSEQRKWWSDKNAGIKFKEGRPAEIVSQGNDVATSIQWMNVTDAGHKKPGKLVITSVWRKLPEGWRVVLAHETLTP